MIFSDISCTVLSFCFSTFRPYLTKNNVPSTIFFRSEKWFKSPPLPQNWKGAHDSKRYVAKRNVGFGLKCAFFFVIHTVSQSTLALDCKTVECREKRLKAKWLINSLSLKAELGPCLSANPVLRYFYLQ